ncbi:DUF1206 domain-containing protein [Streptomyces physcomitrii]|uniref:DUF1206 domain-containing protein n=1 Tax=Streptomyces physcomitrii TaxID=2724184 RepID=UPI003434E7B7
MKTARSSSRRAHTQARRAADSTAVRTGARAGFAARGALYLLIGVLALRIAFADGGGKQADRGGALKELSGQPFGSVLLWTLGIALGGMALWRFSEAAFATTGTEHKARGRALAAVRGVFYAFVCYSVLSYAVGSKSSGSGQSDDQSQDVTARALEWPGGQWIVGLAGAVVVGIGVTIGVRAALRKFHKHLKLSQMSRKVRRAVDITGVVGGVARGVLFASAGGFAIRAAFEHEPGKAKGMDDTLRSFVEMPAGPWLLALIAVGLVAFGVFSFLSAKWRKV